jgi:acyl-CoA synthetase (AMP-forming)/AMP-acid ligase II
MSFEPVNLGDLFDPDRAPDKTSLIAVDPDGEARSFSYRTLDRAIVALAADLASRGLRRGARVALLGANSAEYLVAYLAIMRVGLVAVPFNTQLADATIAFILEDAAAEFAFADRERLAALPSRLASAAFGAIAIENAPEARVATVTPEPREVAMILYTSGSTGRPKGAAGTCGTALVGARPAQRLCRAGSRAVSRCRPAVSHERAFGGQDRLDG